MHTTQRQHHHLACTARSHVMHSMIPCHAQHVCMHCQHDRLPCTGKILRSAGKEDLSLIKGGERFSKAKSGPCISWCDECMQVLTFLHVRRSSARKSWSRRVLAPPQGSLPCWISVHDHCLVLVHVSVPWLCMQGRCRPRLASDGHPHMALWPLHTRG